jgi:hypothetical protein
MKGIFPNFLLTVAGPLSFLALIGDLMLLHICRELPFTYARTANISNTNVSNVESLSHLMSKMLRCGSIIYGYYDTHCCKFVLR